MNSNGQIPIQVIINKLPSRATRCIMRLIAFIERRQTRKHTI